jgi:hypothetical protein
MAIQSDNAPEILTLDQWKGLNQQAHRGSIDDQEEFWNENLFAIGPGDLRSCWGKGAPIYNAGKHRKIVRMFFGFIGYPTPQFSAPPPGRFAWLFLDDGNVDQVDLDNKQVTNLGVIWQPVPPFYWASAVVWRPRFFGSVTGQNGGVLIGSPQGLYAWDGQTLSNPGDPAPDWLTDLAETDPTAPIPPMPQGLPGIYTMEVYQSRLWVAGKDVISFSAPSNGADFSTTGGGGSVGYFGNKLTYTYMDLAASAGYLFVFGDSSTDLISNVILTGDGSPENPYTTNFNYANLDPQVGHRFPRQVGRMGRYFVMLNGAGIFEMEGGDAREIGEKTTNVYATLDTSQYMPTMATATMFGFRVLLVNGRFTDPWGVTRSLLLMWHPVRGNAFWSVASQGLELTQIGHYEQDSICTPYGTDGQFLYQLFSVPDPNLQKILATKQMRGTGRAQLVLKNFKRLYLEVASNTLGGASLTGTMTSGGGGVPGGSEDVAFDLPAGKLEEIIPQPLSGAGIWGQVDLRSTSADFTIERLHIAAEERTLFGA